MESLMPNPLEGCVAGAAASVPAPSSLLLPLCDSLGALNASVAEKFLALAAILLSNSTQARKITAESHRATGSEANLRGSRSIEVLQRILAETAGTGEMVETSTEKMAEILTLVNALIAPLRRLAKMRSQLQIVSVLCRIDGGRLIGKEIDISGLSHDIDALAADVQSRIDGILEDSTVLSGVLRDGVSELKKFGRQERTGANELIERTQAVLRPALARLETAKAAASDIDEQYARFNSSVSKVVVSLQSEDMARQRIEHVQGAIRRVALALDAGDRIESCAVVLALQRAQLAGTRDLLADAVASIQSSLLSLGPRIVDLVARTAVIARQAEEDGQSFTALIDGGLGTLEAVFQQCSSSLRAVVSIVDGVLPPLTKMTGGASALQRIEASIRLISLNATVKAAHLGNEGAAMGVLAAELHTIVGWSGGDSRMVLDGLTAIEEALTTMTLKQSASGGSLMADGSGAGVSAELGELSQAIKDSSREMGLGLASVEHLSEELCIELNRAGELAVDASSIAELFDREVEKLDEVLNRLGLTRAMVAATAAGSRTEDLAGLYSMESERLLHLRILGGPASLADTPPHLPVDAGGSEFGDDVELF
jgi:hypothetical protein